MVYHFVVSSTSTSTKVRMMTDSSMKTDKGLSLNKVTKPAPGDIPNLRSILNHSRCTNHFSVFDIKKFIRSVRISDRESYLRIVFVPHSWIHYRDRAIPFCDRTFQEIMQRVPKLLLFQQTSMKSL